MKALLTSTDISLLNIFQSESFQLVNFGRNEDYMATYFDIAVVPSIGSFMYFIDNSYEQIAVKITNVIHTLNKVVIYCERAYLSDIDPVMYQGNHISCAFVEKVKDIYVRWNKYLNEGYEKDKKTYGDDCSMIGCYGVNINRIIKYDEQTAIDHQNIHYAICQILSENYPEVFGEWHRPYKYEYSDY